VPERTTNPFRSKKEKPFKLHAITVFYPTISFSVHTMAEAVPEMKTIQVRDVRLCCQGLFERMYETNGFVDPKRMAEETEQSIFSDTPLPVPTDSSSSRIVDTTYYHRTCQLYAVIDPTQYVGNKELIELLRSGEIEPSRLATMTPAELFPSRWKTIQKRLALERERKEAAGFRTDQFTCSRCRGKDCSYYQLQTRSADEPITTFVTCLTCTKRWRS